MTPVRERTAWLQGGGADCPLSPPAVHRIWRLFLLGPPGVGKGTQAGLLSRALGACPLSTGDLFRAARARDAAPGSAMARARACMERGELVPDDLVLALVRERARCLHCRGGFLLDGFPRTAPQADAIDALLATEHLTLDAVVSYELPDAELAARISGRRVCPECKAVFHLTGHPPAADGVCDRCGAQLAQRADDRPEAARTRLAAYATDTAPLIAHYRACGLLLTVDATGRPEEIFARTLDALAERILAV